MKTYQNLVAGDAVSAESYFTTASRKFAKATKHQVNNALEAAATTFVEYSQTSLKKRQEFLVAINKQLTSKREEILIAYQEESSLPQGRAEGEFGRTQGQIQSFIHLLERGEFLQASIDRPTEGAALRKMLHPIGPIAVFGASNFPLAFSTAGGDTISAFAAGCPVIVKAHPFHPLTSVLVAHAIQAAVEETQLPKGVFSHLQSDEHLLGQLLVKHHLLKGVGFTGSYKGGRTLYDLAQKRVNPIPVFAEMGSINPMILYPSALKKPNLVQQLGDSITLGGGQFCTNPGLLITVGDTNTLDAFEAALSNYLMEKEAHPMVHLSILTRFREQLQLLDKRLIKCEGKEAFLGVTTAKEFVESEVLKEEVFGPYSLLVRCENNAQVEEILETIDGQLTITLLGEEEHLPKMKSMLPLAQQKAGRILFEGVPTGVAVTQTMTHGGPFPASTDGRFTAVGTDAIYRWLRPVSYQDCPSELLPLPLQDSNPWGIPQRINGTLISP